jgi:GNAT superfamily N-acetyltransferase
VVPIRSLGANHRERIGRHLLSLNPQDRYLRFGFVATDEQILRYVGALDFERDEIFGIYNRRLDLIAMAHLAYSVDPSLDTCAEFGVSVLESARGRGFGARLFDRAAMHARNEGVSRMFIVSAQRSPIDLGQPAMLGTQTGWVRGFQRCGNNSLIALFFCVGSRVSTSFK